MKKLSSILAIFIIALTTTHLMSYSPPTSTEPRTYTEVFDSVFVNVSYADATTGILYERSIPFAQLYNFNSNVSIVDTSSSKHFIRAFRELYDEYIYIFF